MAGFSLLELMVSAVIAMVAAVTIFQTMSVSEERRRSTSSGSEGLQSGVFALAALERAIMSAGYNLTAISDTTYRSPVRQITPGTGYVLSSTVPPAPELHLGCSFTVAGVTHRAAPLLARTGGGAGVASDILTVFTGSSSTVPLPVTSTVTGELPAGSTSVSLTSTHGIRVDDWVLVYEQNSAANPGTSRPVACTLTRVAGLPSAPAISPAVITLAAGTAALYKQPMVIHLGPAPTLERFEVDARGRLIVTNLLVAQAQPQVLADNVVAMQVQLGIDIANDDVVDEWINAPAEATSLVNPPNPLPPNAVTSGTPSAGNRAIHQIKAVRVGLLVRSPQFEQEERDGKGGRLGCTTSAASFEAILPARTGDATARLPAMPTSGSVTLSGDQRCFRYNTVTAVLSVRNAVLSEM
jgi:type IV pilus assembly protein PilW